MSEILAEAAGYKAAGGCIVDDRGGALRYNPPSPKLQREVGMPEIWKSVVGYEDVYEVSNLGRVKRVLAVGHGSRAGRILAPRCNRDGYPRASLCAAGVVRDFLVHRLVAAAFIGPEPDGHEVNHIDGNRANPAVANLEYVTSSGNKRHTYDTLKRTRADNRGERNPSAKLKGEDACEIIRRHKGGEKQNALALHFGVTPSLVSQIVLGRAWADATRSIRTG